MKEIARVLIITMLLLAISNTIALAKSKSLPLSVSRTWGYSGFNNDIQGHFTFSVRQQKGLQRVQFLLDGNVVLEVSEPPFKFKLNTDNYENGVHTLSAVGIFSDGTRISSTPFTRKFVPPIRVRMFRGLWPMLIIPLVIIALFDAVLKVIGMWKAARRTQTAWFVCLMIFNTACILPVIYFLTSGKKPETLRKN